MGWTSYTKWGYTGIYLHLQGKTLDPVYFIVQKFHQIIWDLLAQNIIRTDVIFSDLTLLHSKRPKLHGVLAVLSAIGLSEFG